MRKFFTRFIRHPFSAKGARPLTERAGLIVAWLVVITILAILIAIGMATFAEIEHDTLWYEIGSLIAQAGILTGFGALVAVLVHEYQQDQAEAKQASDEKNQRIATTHQWLRDFAIEMSKAYAETKQARRRLQWDFDPTANALSAAVYRKQFTKISAVQSRFETLRAMADTSLLSLSRRQEVTSRLETIDNVLSKVVSERKERRVAASNDQISLAGRTKLRAFVATSKETGLFEGDDGFNQVKTAYKGIHAWIVAELRDESAPPASDASRTPDDPD